MWQSRINCTLALRPGNSRREPQAYRKCPIEGFSVPIPVRVYQNTIKLYQHACWRVSCCGSCHRPRLQAGTLTLTACGMQQLMIYGQLQGL